jgi:hypothetical protein
MYSASARQPPPPSQAQTCQSEGFHPRAWGWLVGTGKPLGLRGGWGSRKEVKVWSLGGRWLVVVFMARVVISSASDTELLIYPVRCFPYGVKFTLEKLALSVRLPVGG